MTRYRFPDRATAELAHDEQEQRVQVLNRLVATLSVTEGGFDYVDVAQGEYQLRVRENEGGIVEGVEIYDPGNQRPSSRAILDLEAELTLLKRTRQGVRDNALHILYVTALREIEAARNKAEVADDGPFDSEPPDIDSDMGYDPYTGGDDFMREHGEDFI